MDLLFALLLLLLTVTAIIYPLFFSKVQNYFLNTRVSKDFSEADALLCSLSELEDDYLLGRLDKKEYQSQKIRLQRSYLKTKEAPATS